MNELGSGGIQMIQSQSRIASKSVAVKDGRIKRGDTIVLEAMGGGFTWGAAVLSV